MVNNCKSFYEVKSGDQCSAILSNYGITLSQFTTWNPAVGSTCTALWVDTYVCVSTTGSAATTTTSVKTPTPTSGNGISTPSPIQTGMTSSCKTFYKTKSGDGCAAIATSYSISLTNFYTWNPAVGSTCASLWADTYVCVGLIGGSTGSSPTTTLKPTKTDTGNGISTPTPFQPGMIASCKKFRQVVSGDECGKIASGANVALTDFYKWNPGVGNSCASLWLGYFVCIGI